MNMWHNVGHSLDLNLSYNKRELGHKRAHFFLFSRLERKREEEEKVRASNFSLRSTELRWSDFVELITKVHLLSKSYMCVPEKEDFAKDPSEKFGGIRGFGFMKCPRGFLMVLSCSKRYGFFLPWFIFHFWARNGWMFEFLL